LLLAAAVGHDVVAHLPGRAEGRLWIRRILGFTPLMVTAVAGVGGVVNVSPSLEGGEEG